VGQGRRSRRTRPYRNAAIPPPSDVVNGFVVRARRQLGAVYHLLDGGFDVEALSINRDLLDTSTTLAWLVQDWEERFRRWCFDDVRHQITWFKELEVASISDETRAEIEAGVARLEAVMRVLRTERGAKGLPKPEDMYRDLGAQGMYRRQYRVVSHVATHSSLFSMNPGRPSLEWSLIVANPYRMAALSLWAVLHTAESFSSRGWGARLADIRPRITTPD